MMLQIEDFLQAEAVAMLLDLVEQAGGTHSIAQDTDQPHQDVVGGLRPTQSRPPADYAVISSEGARGVSKFRPQPDGSRRPPRFHRSPLGS